MINVRASFEQWSEALVTFSKLEYRLFVGLMICDRRGRPAVIRAMLVAARRAKLGKRETYRTIANILGIHPETVRYHERKTKTRRHPHF